MATGKLFDLLTDVPQVFVEKRKRRLNYSPEEIICNHSGKIRKGKRLCVDKWRRIVEKLCHFVGYLVVSIDYN